MTKRKPLEWYLAGDRLVPDCPACMGRLSVPFLMEAVYSVSIEAGGDPVVLARSMIDAFHAGRHTDP